MTVGERQTRTKERVRGDNGLRHLHCTLIAVHVIRVTVRIDHVLYDESLLGGPGDEGLGRVRGVDEHGALRRAIAEEIAEVAIAAGADLFEDKLHPAIVTACGTFRPAVD
jgi:hypothetical protein